MVTNALWTKQNKRKTEKISECKTETLTAEKLPRKIETRDTINKMQNMKAKRRIGKQVLNEISESDSDKEESLIRREKRQPNKERREEKKLKKKENNKKDREKRKQRPSKTELQQGFLQK